MTETGEHIALASETGKCLDPEWIRMLVDGEASPARIAQIEEHLAACPKCRAQLEKESGGAALWELARKSLSMAVPLGAENDASPGGSSPPDPMLSLLDPSNNPEMLGALGAYEIAGVLGKGGMGVVLKAYDPSLGRYVAIKLLAPHLAANANARKRFAREAKAAAAVAHDHVIAIHGVSEFKGIPFLVMPLIRGESLQKRLRAEGQLPVEVILRIAMQTASGLAAAHSQGLIHRDVKPANILLGPGTERVTLTDFGLARAVDEVDLTVTGMLPGTPRYMSPEQARGEILDARTDLFSLGLVLYEMAAGQSPFRADSSYAVLRKISEAEPKPLAEFRTDLPEWLIQIISRLLAKNPLDRLASARDLERLLADGLAHLQAPKSNAAPRLGLLAQPAASRERANDFEPAVAASPGRQALPRESSSTSWISGRWLAGAALLMLVVLFFYPLIKGEAFTLTLGLATLAGLLLFFGPWGLAYRSRLVAAYSPDRRALQMGVFGLAVVGVGFLIFQTETQIAKMHQMVWAQGQALQNRLNEWNGLKGAIAETEWKKESDLLEYAISTVNHAHMLPGESFSLFAGVAILAILTLAVWGLTFWKRCHPAWIAAGVGLATVWGFYSLIQAETTVHRVIGDVNTPEIWQHLRASIPTAFTDPVVVIADKKEEGSKEFQLHIRPGYAVFGTVRVRENGNEIPDMSFWAGQGHSTETPFKMKLQYRFSNYPETMSANTPHLLLSGEPKHISGMAKLSPDVERVIEGIPHEVWVFPEAEVGDTEKTVSLARFTRADPMRPREATTHWDLVFKVAKLPPSTSPELSKEFAFKGLHWKEEEWRRELGLHHSAFISDLNDAGKLISQEMDPNQFKKRGSRIWKTVLPAGMVVDFLPVEVSQQSSRPIDALRAFYYNQSEKSIVFQYLLGLDQEPKDSWPEDHSQLAVSVSNVGRPNEFPAGSANANPFWLRGRKWIADPQSMRGPVKSGWIKALDRGVLPAYASIDSGTLKENIEVRVRYHRITVPAGMEPIGSGIGQPWWQALRMEAPHIKEGTERDELVDMELSADGANIKVLGLNVPLSVVGPLIAKDGFSKNASLRLRVSRDTAAVQVKRVLECFKSEGYANILLQEIAPRGPNRQENGAAPTPPTVVRVVPLKRLAADSCVRAIEHSMGIGSRGDAPANSMSKKEGATKFNVKIIADTRTNSVILLGVLVEMEKVIDMIKEIDEPKVPQKNEEKKDSKKDK